LDKGDVERRVDWYLGGLIVFFLFIFPLLLFLSFKEEFAALRILMVLIFILLIMFDYKFLSPYLVGMGEDAEINFTEGYMSAFPVKELFFVGFLAIPLEIAWGKDYINIPEGIKSYFCYLYQSFAIYWGVLFIWSILMVKFPSISEGIRKRIAQGIYLFTFSIFGSVIMVSYFLRGVGGGDMNFNLVLFVRYFLIFFFILTNILGWGYLYRFTFREVDSRDTTGDKLIHIIVVWFIQSISSFVSSSIRIFFLGKNFEGYGIDLVFEPIFVVFFFLWYLVGFSWFYLLVKKGEGNYFNLPVKLRRYKIIFGFMVNVGILVFEIFCR